MVVFMNPAIVMAGLITKRKVGKMYLMFIIPNERLI